MMTKEKKGLSPGSAYLGRTTAGLDWGYCLAIEGTLGKRQNLKIQGTTHQYPLQSSLK